MDLSYILNHLGEEREEVYGAVSPPIFQTSNFCFSDVATLRAELKNEFERPFYTRGYNPTVATLRKKLAALENAEDALVFGSGSGAIATAVMSEVKAGDHVVCVKKPYSWTNKLLNQFLSRFGVETTMVDGRDMKNFEDAIRENTSLIYLESPNSITFELQDLRAVAQLAKPRGITTIIDNSYSTPLHQRPHELGIDMVVHSASKYLGGHSDIVAGVLCSTKERITSIFSSEFMTLGGIISPNDAWLMIRGLRTLEIRLQKTASSALKVAEFLEQHPKVEKVIYPYSSSHPQYELAKQQMKGGSGLLSFIPKVESRDEVDQICDRLRMFLLACSWGGHESLAFPLGALADAQSGQEETLPIGLIRLYIGLEDPDDLIADLNQALG